MPICRENYKEDKKQGHLHTIQMTNKLLNMDTW